MFQDLQNVDNYLPWHSTQDLDSNCQWNCFFSNKISWTWFLWSTFSSAKKFLRFHKKIPFNFKLQQYRITSAGISKPFLSFVQASSKKIWIIWSCNIAEITPLLWYLNLSVTFLFLWKITWHPQLKGRKVYFSPHFTEVLI